MVFWSSSQLDEDGLRVKGMVEGALSDMKRPAADFLTVVQTGDCQHPAVTLRTPSGIRSFKVSLVVLAHEPDEAIAPRIRQRMERLYQE